MREIELTRGYKAVIDDDDYGLVSQYKWQARIDNTCGNVYASARKWVDGKRITILMHRIIIVCESEVDHINGNTLDNRRDNLRPSNRVQQSRNRRSSKSSTSTYKGVCFANNRGKPRPRPWHAQIRYGGTTYHIGYYDTEEDAARAYDQRAFQVFGADGVYNFPEELATDVPLRRNSELEP